MTKLQWRDYGTIKPNLLPDPKDITWSAPTRLNTDTIRLNLLKRNPAMHSAILEVADELDYEDQTSELIRIKPLFRAFTTLSKNFVHGRDDINKSGWSTNTDPWPIDDDFADFLYASIADNELFPCDPTPNVPHSNQWTVLVVVQPNLLIAPLRRSW